MGFGTGRLRLTLLVAPLLAVAASAVAARPADAALLSVAHNPTSVRAPGGLVTYSVSLVASSGGTAGVSRVDIASMSDTFGPLDANCGPFPKSFAFAWYSPGTESQPICTFSRKVRGKRGATVQNQIVAQGGAETSYDLIPPNYGPWAVSSSPTVHIKRAKKCAKKKRKKCAKKKRKAKRRCKARAKR